MKPDTNRHIEILIFVLLGILGIFLFTYYFSYVSREAAIDFKITRQQALQLGEQYLAKQGYNLKGYRPTVVFSSDDDEAEYVEKTLGLSSANRLYQKDVPVWYWDCRWFKELQKEEFSCQISPDGRIIGYSHDIKDEEPRPSISEDSAKILALSMITTIPNIQASEYKLIETVDNKMLHRMDYSFTFEKDQPKIKDGSIRLTLELQGTQLDGFYRFVHIPETYERAQTKISSYRSLLMSVDSIFDSGLYLGIFILLLLGFKAKHLRWKLIFPVALTLAILSILNSLNEIPTTFYYYDTTSTWYSFIGGELGSSLLGAATEGLMLWILGVAGWYALRYFREKKTLLPSAGYIQRIAPRGLASATVIGYSGALIQLGYVAVFYMLGYKYFNVFSPADISYSNYLASWLPWLFPLTIAMSASLNEEFIYRLFAIPFLQKLVKYRWIAIILPAFIWGFAHSFYNVEPIYIRGIEVGLVGIFLGCIFYRYGILATIIIHYVYDCVLFALPMLRSSNTYFMVSGLMVCLLMVLPGILLTWFSPRFKQESLESDIEEPVLDTELTDTVPIPQETPVPETGIADTSAATVTETRVEAPFNPADYFYYRPLNKGIIALLIILTLGGAGYAVWKNITHPNQIPPQYVLDKKEAEVKATQFIQQMKIPAQNYFKTTSSSGNYHGTPETYMSRLISEDSIRAIYRYLKDDRDGWETNWFKVEDPETFSVSFDYDGVLQSFNYTYKEERPGASLSKETAIMLVESFLRQQNINPADYKLIESDSDKKPNRLDWDMTFEHKTVKVKDMTVRMYVSLAGDKISYFSRVSYDVPEEFSRNLSKINIYSTIYGIIMSVIGLGFTILVIIQLFKMFRNKEFLWKRVLWIVISLSVISLIHSINGIPSIINSYAYNTMTPLVVFISGRMISFISGILFGFLSLWFLITYGFACYRRLAPEPLTLPRAVGLLHPRHWGHPAYFQGLLLVIALRFIPIPFAELENWIINHWFMGDKTGLLETFSFSYSGLINYSPFLTHILSSLTKLFWMPFTAVIMFAIYFYWFKKWDWKLLALMGFVIAIAGIWIDINSSWQYRLYDSIKLLVIASLILGFIYKISWKNWCFYLLSHWMLTFINNGIPYLYAYHWTWQLEGIIYIVIGIIPAVVIPYQYWRNRGKYSLK